MACYCVSGIPMPIKDNDRYLELQNNRQCRHDIEIIYLQRKEEKYANL